MDLNSTSEEESADAEYAGNVREVRRRNEIIEEGLQLPHNALEDLSDSDFPQPIDEATASALSLSLCVLNKHLDDLYKKLLAGWEMTNSLLAKLKTIRRTLLNHLVSPTERVENERIEEFDGYRKHISLQENLFCALLECVSCIVTAPQMAALKEYTPSRFPDLQAQHLIVEDLLHKPFVMFRETDLFFSIRILEQNWTIIKYAASLTLFLDCLLARLAVVYRTPTKERIVGNLENYQACWRDDYYVVSSVMLQDFCWSMIPMYRKLYRYESLRTADIPDAYRLTKDKRYAIREIFITNAVRMTNTALIENFRDLYMVWSERPSERRRFMRCSTKDPRIENIWKKMRGAPFVRRHMVLLNQDPWVLAREGKAAYKRCELDLMIMLMANSYISNMSGIDFRKTFVLLANEFEPNHPLLNVDYPILFQAFNHFGLYYKKVYYCHDNFVTSLWHWYDIMRGPPFHKEFEHKVIELGELYRVATD